MPFRRAREQPVALIAQVVAAGLFGSGALAQTPPIAASSSAGQVPAGQSSAGANTNSAAWFVVGGADPSAILQALRGGRALLCETRRCAIWDTATRTSTPTEGVSVPTDRLAHIGRRDGDVLAVAGTGTNRPQIWDHVTGHWSTGAALPEPLREIRLAELGDGRIVAAGETSAGRARAYVADRHLTGWSVLIDGPPDRSHASIFPMEWGALLSTGVRVWRHVIGTEGWQRLEPAIPLSALAISVKPWGAEVLLTYQDGGRWSASLVGRDGQLRPVADLPNAGSRFGLISIGTSGADNMWLLSADKDYYLWRRPDEPPLALPSDLIALSPNVVATDDEHLLGIALSGPLIEMALNGIGPSGRACDGLLRYLSTRTAYRASGSERALVSVQCREEARRGGAADLLALVRSWAADSTRADIGRALECALQDKDAVGELPEWLRSGMDEHARSVCYQSLATWPGTDGVWKPALDRAVYERPDHWYVDGAIIEWASMTSTPEMHERLLPVVRAAATHHAVGFDALRSAVCVTDPGSSEARRQACSELASQHESDWRHREADLEAQHQRNASVKRHIPLVIASTVVVGGAVTAAYAARDNDAGRGIAVVSGALAGATIGLPLSRSAR
jgi:hypothetical protein